MQRIYLDHNATTPLAPEAREAMFSLLGSGASNASSIHHEGQLARSAIEEARRNIANLIQAGYPDILFTSGATEANNLALSTLLKHTSGAIVSSVVEHPSVLAPLQKLEKEGKGVAWLPVDELGKLPPVEEIMALAEAAGAGALSLMLANNETGNINQIAQITAAAHERGWKVHCDATQAIGKIPVDVRELGVDLLTLSSHKFYGPTGAGALYIRNALELSPIILGGHQERGRRGGTENLLSIAGMGQAAKLAQALLTEDAARIASLRDTLWQHIQRIEPSAVRQGDLENTLPNTLNVRFSDVDGETLLINLDLEGIAVSAGSACTAGSLEPSHVVLAMGVPADSARGSVRFSLGRYTTAEEIELVAQRLPTVLARTRSPAW